MSGRVNGMYSWRLGWRGDILSCRGLPPRAPPLPPADDSGAEELLPTAAIENPQCERAYRWWRSVCHSPQFVLGPMIGQSERAFRILCRERGAVGLCYTPMYEAEKVNKGMHDAELLSSAGPYVARDRPLICQLAGHDPEAMLAAAERVQDFVDGVDINLGCPQRCADIGNYGAYLLERDLTLVCNIIRLMTSRLRVAVTAKIRLQDGEIQHTIDVARKLEQAGIFALCVHGRGRAQREHDGPADWGAVKAIKKALSIPVICNGSIQSSSDALDCLRYTGVDAVMSATGLLRNPALFISHLSAVHCECQTIVPTGNQCPTFPSSLSICRLYLDYAAVCWSSDGDIAVNGKDKLSVIREHMLGMLQIHLMDVHQDIWSLLASRSVQSIRQFRAILDYITVNVFPHSENSKGDILPLSLRRIKKNEF